jgi:glycosyltransferase involved in cell wall biosynthesis
VDRPRNRLGFFGQLNPFKGVDVLLKAMKILGASVSGVIGGASPRETDPHLWIHGANLEFQRGGFQVEFRDLLEASKSNVTFVGRYDRAGLAKLMANIDWVVVPSIWWENSPLVIQEAFGHGRPVICSDIGAMAEKVHDGVNGLHFHVADPTDLAETIKRATTTAGLWQRLVGGIPEVYPMEQHVGVLSGLYNTVLKT